MLVIRYNRTGKRNRAHFRVVLQEHTKAPGKRHVEMLGSYDPIKKTTILNKDRILYWIGQGAKPSDVVFNLLVKEGIVEGKKIVKKMPRPVVKEAPVEAEAAPVEEVKAEPATETVSGEAAPAVEAEAAPAEEVKAEEVVAAEVPAEEKKEEAPAA
jgi:small subunit ribosomal protein S16